MELVLLRRKIENLSLIFFKTSSLSSGKSCNIAFQAFIICVAEALGANF